MRNKNKKNEFVYKFIFFFINKRKHVKHVRLRICEKLMKENIKYISIILFIFYYI